MKNLKYFVLIITFFIFSPFFSYTFTDKTGLVFAYESEVKAEKGYFYIVLKKASFKKADAILKEKIKEEGWQIIHTLNVDKTAGMKTYYKTYLLCKASYLKKGVYIFKEIGNLLPCRITIRTEGSKVIIMVEDIVEISKLYNVKDKRFGKFINNVQEELIDILIKTKNKLEPKGFIPQY